MDQERHQDNVQAPGRQETGQPDRQEPPQTDAPAGQESEAGGKGKRNRRIAVLMIIAAVLMVLGMTAALLYARWVKRPELPTVDGPDPQESLSAQPLQSAPPEDDGAGVQPKVGGRRRSEDFFTILVFGRDETSGLTDTIMVASYDVTNQQATVMSIPRDTLVNVRSSYKSINGVYSGNGGGEQGTAALKNEVSELIGFTPDFCVMIDWELVGKMVDAIGGVYFDVPYHMDYDDDYQDLHIDRKSVV